MFWFTSLEKCCPSQRPPMADAAAHEVSPKIQSQIWHLGEWRDSPITNGQQMVKLYKRTPHVCTR